jgi:hypothetical protein
MRTNCQLRICSDALGSCLKCLQVSPQKGIIFLEKLFSQCKSKFFSLPPTVEYVGPAGGQPDNPYHAFSHVNFDEPALFRGEGGGGGAGVGKNTRKTPVFKGTTSKFLL